MCLLKILLIFAAAMLAVNAQCDNLAVNACISNFTSKYPNSGDFTTYSDSTVTAICKDYRTASDCLKPKLADCGVDVAVAWEAIDNILLFMCSDDTLSVLKNNGQCLVDKQSNLQEGVNKCTDKYKTQIGSNTDEVALCKVLQGMVSCVADAAKAQCGDKVADWFRRYIGVTWESLTGDLTNCDISSDSPVAKYSSVFLGMCLAVGIVMRN